MAYPRRPVSDVLAERVVRSAPDRTDQLNRPLTGPCLMWPRPFASAYPIISNRNIGPGLYLVHRVAYALEHGIDFADVPDLRSLCKVRGCSAPLHWAPVGDVMPMDPASVRQRDRARDSMRRFKGRNDLVGKPALRRSIPRS
jgi:hypothetical protein